MRWNWPALILGALAAFLCLLLLARSHSEILRDADSQASIRLLAEFHVEYLTKKGLSLEDYRKELASFESKYAGFEQLEKYVKSVKAE